jgi:hypothetical protein
MPALKIGARAFEQTFKYGQIERFLMPTFQGIKECVSGARFKLAIAMPVILALVASASAIDFSGITDLLDEIILIFPALVAMVVASIPIIVVIALMAFILGFLDTIVSKIR